MFRNFQPRLYQETIFAQALNQNTLVVLPTGLGKTAISAMLCAARIKKHPESKMLILAPTRPLVNQHLESFKELIDPSFLHEDEFVVFTGMIKAEKRQELWKESRVIFSTPQGLENDILSGKISLKEVSLLVFDEAHRATGDYSYVWVANQYMKHAKNPLILALTASPGSDKETIEEVCNNLHINHIEMRDKDSPDVAPYVKETKIKWIEVELPEEFKEILTPLREMFAERIKKIQNSLKASNPYLNIKYVKKTDILGLQAKLQGQIGKVAFDPELYQTISTTAQILKLQHAVELLETQGLEAARMYMDDLWKQGKASKNKAVVNITQDSKFKIAISKIWAFSDKKLEHPKLEKTAEIIQEYIKKKPDAKIIVFNNYRDSIAHLKKLLDTVSGVKSAIFVGQAKKKGMGSSQKEQLQLIREFKDGIHNVMIMSSVGEEGLDIPAVDLVMFYEPVPSAIRQIQRAGRTGRQEKGEVIVLIAKDTKDVAYRWATENKKKKMYDILEKTKKTLVAPQIQQTLQDSISKNIIVDSREKANRIVKLFVDLGYSITLQQLAAGDYILAEDIGVEFKTKKDFVDSVVDGRLLSQASALTRAYTRPIIIVQGEEDIYSIRNIHPNAIAGALATLAVSFKIPVLFTQNEQESFRIMQSLANRQKGVVEHAAHAFKPKSDEEMQEFIIEALPGVGPTLAKDLLKHFGSVEKVISATISELSEVRNVGKVKAENIRKIIEKKYS